MVFRRSTDSLSRAEKAALKRDTAAADKVKLTEDGASADEVDGVFGEQGEGTVNYRRCVRPPVAQPPRPPAELTSSSLLVAASAGRRLSSS